MNTSVETIPTQTPQVYLTYDAAQKLHQLFLEEGKEDLKLRIFIEGGGCSGFKYEFAFETTTHGDDKIFKKTVENKSSLIFLAICASYEFFKDPMVFISCCLVNEAGCYEVEVVIDSMSFLYLQNSEVDYEENFQDSRFIIRNPNAQSSCGCGSSFSV